MFSPIATSTRVGGTTTIAGGQALTASYLDPIAATPLPDESVTSIVLVGLTQPGRAALTYPVTFTFERGAR